jgi:hypothetical protein
MTARVTLGEDRGDAVRGAVVGHREGQAVGLVSQAHVGGRARTGVPQHVGQRLLQDAVRGVVRFGGQRPLVSLDGHRHRGAGRGDRGAQRLQASQAGLRRIARRVVATGLGPPELAEDRPHLGQGSLARFPDRG